MHTHAHPDHRQGRRSWLWSVGGGIGGVALARLLCRDGMLGADDSSRSELPHHAPRARSVIQLFCAGAKSQIDTFDHKPELERLQGKPFDASGKLRFFASRPGKFQASYWKFRRHGECGRPVSDLLPHLATKVDEMAFVHSMVSRSAVHGPAMFLAGSGFSRPGFPTMGSWVAYGLGSEADDLPAFVVLPDSRGVPPSGPANWGAGFLPAVYQGTTFSAATGRAAIADLFPPEDPALTPASEAAARSFLAKINRRHAAVRPGDTELEARITSYELAARLQLSAPEVTELSGESRATKALYGIDEKLTDDFGRRCLLARRLVERGVRFVQVWCGADNTSPPRANWDAHEDVRRNHGLHGKIFDRPAAALLEDLRARGLLDQTLVIATSEFGRMPAAEQGKGRDHNPHAFTTWMAGGGIRGGVSHGASDEFSFKVAESPSSIHDIHATALHLLGLDHERLTFYHNGVERRLTDVHGHVLAKLLVGP